MRCFVAAQLLAVLTTVQAATTPRRRIQDSFACTSDLWRCDSGDCIYHDDLCDGTAHCVDGSDETAEHCIHLTCPKYAFRCAYGTCIAGNQRCNGVRNCADGSDETDRECGRNLEALEHSLRGNCSNLLTQLQCSSGECVDEDRRCDGVADCADGSDETVQLCSHLFCPHYAFRCGYGGCIRGNAKCDGRRDCVDGSDEAAELCGCDRQRPRPTPSAPTEPQSSCTIPFHRRHLQVEDAETRTSLRLGSCVAPGQKVFFSCAPGFLLRGVEQNECIDGRWRFAVAHCKKFCSPHSLSRGVSTVVACTYNQRPVNCSAPIAIGTRAHVSCATGYQQASMPRPPLTTMLTCDADGEWDYPKFKCEPRCGEADAALPLAQLPWHAEVFQRLRDGSVKVVCAGAIIAPRLIISAASCFPDPDEAFRYHVVLGPHREQHNVSEILFPSRSLEPRYLDSRTLDRSRPREEHDIAVLVLVNLLDFAQPYRPICLPNLKRRPSDQGQRNSPNERVTLKSRERAKFGSLGPGYAIGTSRERNLVLASVVSEVDAVTEEVTLMHVQQHAPFLLHLLQHYRHEL